MSLTPSTIPLYYVPSVTPDILCRYFIRGQQEVVVLLLAFLPAFQCVYPIVIEPSTGPEEATVISDITPDWNLSKSQVFIIMASTMTSRH